MGEMSMTHKTGRITLRFLLAFVFFFCTFLPYSRVSAATAAAMLDRGPVVNDKMRYLSAGEELENWQQTGNIKAVHMADSLPDGFVPTEENTVSAADSEVPIYIFYKDDEDAGILFFYTEGGRIIMNPDSQFLFFGFPVMTDISGVADWDTSQVVNMQAMFARAKSLPDALALRNWDTSNVINMDYMFSGASSLVYIDVSNWNTGNAKSMTCMFQVGDNYEGNGQLCEILGIENLDVSNVTDMTCMFYGAGKMTQYDIDGWDVSKVESMNHMFCDNFSLRSLDLSRWDVSSVRTMYCMFDDNRMLKTIGNVSHWNTASLIDAGGWLNNADSFVGDNSGTLDLSGWDTSNLKAVGEMFSYTKIQTIDLSGWTFDAITNDSWEGAGRGIYYEHGNGNVKMKGFGQMFMKTIKLTNVYVSEAGLKSFNAAVESGVNTEDMWTGSKCINTGFTVKQQGQ